MTIEELLEGIHRALMQDNRTAVREIGNLVDRFESDRLAEQIKARP